MCSECLSSLSCDLQLGEKQADSEMEKERERRTEEMTEDEYKRRVAISLKLIDVQKELLSTHKPVKVLYT